MVGCYPTDLLVYSEGIYRKIASHNGKGVGLGTILIVDIFVENFPF